MCAGAGSEETANTHGRGFVHTERSAERDHSHQKCGKPPGMKTGRTNLLFYISMAFSTP